MVFSMLLAIQFVLEFFYFILYVAHREVTFAELDTVYGAKNRTVLEAVFWMAFGIQLTYSSLYYFLSMLCLGNHKPGYYRMFSTLCLFGVIGEISLAYINKFNLPVFFLRILAYIYAKFLKGLTQNMQILGIAGVGGNGGGDDNDFFYDASDGW